MALAAFASGLAGALLGATFGAWAVRNEPLAEAGSGRAAAESSAELARRVAALERALAEVGPRGLAASGPGAALDAADDVGETLDGADVAGAGPVFEATVIDLVGKPPAARDGARAPARERDERDRYWAQELTMQLGLTPAQTERLRAIQAELQRGLARVEGMPSDERHAARRALQRDAEQQLRSALAPRQLAAYEALDARLKLYAAAN